MPFAFLFGLCVHFPVYVYTFTLSQELRHTLATHPYCGVVKPLFHSPVNHLRNVFDVQACTNDGLCDTFRGAFSTIFLFMVDMKKSRAECEEFIAAEAKREAFATES